MFALDDIGRRVALQRIAAYEPAVFERLAADLPPEERERLRAAGNRLADRDRAAAQSAKAAERNNPQE